MYCTEDRNMEGWELMRKRSKWYLRFGMSKMRWFFFFSFFCFFFCWNVYVATKIFIPFENLSSINWLWKVKFNDSHLPRSRNPSNHAFVNSYVVRSMLDRKPKYILRIFIHPAFFYQEQGWNIGWIVCGVRRKRKLSSVGIEIFASTWERQVLNSDTKVELFRLGEGTGGQVPWFEPSIICRQR